MPGRPRVAMTVEQCWHRVPGGTAVAVVGAARALEARGEIRPIGVAAWHPRPPRRAWLLPIQVRRLPLPRLALYESWHRLRRPRVQLATGPVEVLHATTIAIPPKSAPLVVTVHDLAFLRNPSHFTARGLSFFRRGLALALRDADLVVCSSVATMRDCEAAGFEPERLRLVPLGVDAALASEHDVARVRRRYGLDSSYLLWTGTIEPRKNLRGLLRALAHVEAGIQLVVAGPKGWNQNLDVLVREAGREVKVLGFVPAEDLGPLYAGARVFCWPSLVEGFGFPVLEAMAQGTPVVTSRGTSTEELAARAGLLVDPRDPASIGAAIQRVLSDDALAARLGAAGRKRAAEYSWDRSARRLTDAYLELAS